MSRLLPHPLTHPPTVGMSGEQAEQEVKKLLPNIKTQLVDKDAMVTMDHNGGGLVLGLCVFKG